MDHDFWFKKWDAASPGFHQEKVNSRLKKHWHKMGMSSGTVFVPLCGSTIDMLWLTDNGFHVHGVELIEIACRKYFSDNNLAVVESSDSRFRYFRGENIELWQGDFFSLEPPDLAQVRCVYDRASLIAFPQNMRQEYAAKLSQLLLIGTRIFLISMDYDESKMKGPPFSVEESEINQIFGQDFSIELITQSSGPDIVGNLAKRGLDTLTEKIYLLEKR